VKGERERARDGPMVFLALNRGSGETGVVIANFDIGKSH
jgi:hypothetical protein